MKERVLVRPGERELSAWDRADERFDIGEALDEIGMPWGSPEGVPGITGGSVTQRRAGFLQRLQKLRATVARLLRLRLEKESAVAPVDPVAIAKDCSGFSNHLQAVSPYPANALPAPVAWKAGKRTRPAATSARIASSAAPAVFPACR